MNAGGRVIGGMRQGGPCHKTKLHADYRPRRWLARLEARHVADPEARRRLVAEVRYEGHELGRAPIRNNRLAHNKTCIIRTKKRG